MSDEERVEFWEYVPLFEFEGYRYRVVHCSNESPIIQRLPRPMRLLTEYEWRHELRIHQSRGWEHYSFLRSEPNALLFRQKIQSLQNCGQ